jgi:mutator protein MutT
MTTIVVTAAVVEREGRFLVTRRQQGVHLEGFWEFPGGKCEPDEPLAACLRREIREELAVDAAIGAELLTTTHAYPERSVELHFFRCDLHGIPAPQLGQEMRWVAREELAGLTFPPADAELIGQLTNGSFATSADAPSTDSFVPASTKSRCT